MAALFDPPVEACVAAPGLVPEPLDAAEAASVAGAVAARRREYALGRTVMKTALRRLGAEAASLPSRPDRSPAWPDGHVGSLTHCEGFCGAVAARRSAVEALGLDAEPARPLEPGVAALVCGPGDAPVAWPAVVRDRLPWPTLVFSAKEAVYKCQHPLTGMFLDFPDVRIGWGRCGEDGRSGRFVADLREGAARALAGRRIVGRWRLAGGLVLTGAWSERAAR